MNAGWHEHEIGEVVREVEYVDADGALGVWPRERCAFSYRTSAFRGRRGVVVGAVLDLSVADPTEVKQRLDSYAASRRQNQPTEVPSCGSVFLKPEGDFAGRLIEQAGLKGTRVGDVEVSRKHANFFVNLGRGTASDALRLIERVEHEVEARFGVRLIREVEVW
jgi:UDP-N-acetylmuramate dehydrogenase